jgi:hypothetical protein
MITVVDGGDRQGLRWKLVLMKVVSILVIHIEGKWFIVCFVERKYEDNFYTVGSKCQ